MPDKIPLGNSHVCTIANLHLPPSLSHPDRRSICSSVATLLCRPRSQVRIICGDLNEHLRPNGGGWLSKALPQQASGLAIAAPTPPGAGTNHVRASSRELDWILISPDTPCLACSKTLLPGSPHTALSRWTSPSPMLPLPAWTPAVASFGTTGPPTTRFSLKPTSSPCYYGGLPQPSFPLTPQFASAGTACDSTSPLHPGACWHALLLFRKQPKP